MYFIDEILFIITNIFVITVGLSNYVIVRLGNKHTIRNQIVLNVFSCSYHKPKHANDQLQIICTIAIHMIKSFFSVSFKQQFKGINISVVSCWKWKVDLCYRVYNYTGRGD